MIISVDGQLVDHITLKGDEPEFNYGYGVFETLRTYNGKGFLVAEHLERLVQSADDIHLALPQSRSQIETWVQQLITEAYKLTQRDVRVKLILGVSHVYITATPLEINQSIYKKGVTVTYQELERATPGTKQLAYWREFQAYQQAAAQGFFETLLVSHKQEVLEGSRSNLFIVRNEVIVTPKQNILQGITRGCVLDLIQPHYQVEERKISFDELLRAEEVFITQTSTGIVPVTRIDQRTIGVETYVGKPGPITKDCLALFNDYVETYTA